MENQNGMYQNGNGQMPSASNGAPIQPSTLSTSGMAVASLVLGIIGIATSFLPIVNNGSFFLAILGVIFGIVGIVGINKGKKKGKGLGIAGIVLSVVTIVVVLVTQSLYSAALDEVASNLSSSSSISASTDQTQQGGASNAVASADTSSAPYEVTIDDATLTTDYAGEQALLVTYTFTNNSDDEASFAVNIMNKAFQNGVQLDMAIGAGADSTASLNTIKPGATTTVSQAFTLTDMSPVTVEVSETFSFNDELIVEKTFDLQ